MAARRGGAQAPGRTGRSASHGRRCRGEQGAYTWFLAQLCRHVYAYEPNPALRWMLTRCTPRNVTIFPRAVSNQSGEQFLRIPLRNGRYANNVGTLRSAFDGDPCEVVPVTCSRLDDDGLMDVGFLKIDVEGHEREVLEGRGKLILRDRRCCSWRFCRITPGGRLRKQSTSSNSWDTGPTSPGRGNLSAGTQSLPVRGARRNLQPETSSFFRLRKRRRRPGPVAPPREYRTRLTTRRKDS